jgi:hypothetical protein
MSQRTAAGNPLEAIGFATDRKSNAKAMARAKRIFHSVSPLAMKLFRSRGNPSKQADETPVPAAPAAISLIKVGPLEVPKRDNSREKLQRISRGDRTPQRDNQPSRADPLPRKKEGRDPRSEARLFEGGKALASTRPEAGQTFLTQNSCLKRKLLVVAFWRPRQTLFCNRWQASQNCVPTKTGGLLESWTPKKPNLRTNLLYVAGGGI